MFIVQLIVFQVFVFTALVIVMRHIMSKNVSAAAERLQSMSDEYLKKEEDLKKEQSKLAGKYNEVVERAKKDAAQIRLKAKEAAKKDATDMVVNARKESEQIVTRAENCTMQVKKEIDERIKSEANVRASKLIEHILPEVIKRQMHAEWMREMAEDGLSALEKMNIPDVVEAEIRSPYKLDQSELEYVKKKLKTHLKREVAIKEELAPELIAGVIIALGSVIIDGSLLSRVEKVVKEM